MEEIKLINNFYQIILLTMRQQRTNKPVEHNNINRKQKTSSYFQQEAHRLTRQRNTTSKPASTTTNANSILCAEITKENAQFTTRYILGCQLKEKEVGVGENIGKAVNSSEGSSEFCSEEMKSMPESKPKQKTRDHFSTLIQGIQMIRKHFNCIGDQIIRLRQIALKETLSSKTKFLMLDLDQTLVYLNREDREDQSAKQKKKFSCKMVYRPYLFEFLEAMQQHYEIYAFTSSKRLYATAIVDKINKNKQYIKDLLHRDHCMSNENNLLYKDLRIIKNRGLQDIVILDNTVQYFSMQLDNGIPIQSFKGDPSDTQLMRLIPFLRQLSHAKDVREILHGKFNLSDLLHVNGNRSCNSEILHLNSSNS